MIWFLWESVDRSSIVFGNGSSFSFLTPSTISLASWGTSSPEFKADRIWRNTLKSNRGSRPEPQARHQAIEISIEFGEFCIDKSYRVRDDQPYIIAEAQVDMILMIASTLNS